MPRYLRTFYLKQIEQINTKNMEDQKKRDNQRSGKSEVFSPPVLPKE